MTTWNRDGPRVWYWRDNLRRGRTTAVHRWTAGYWAPRPYPSGERRQNALGIELHQNFPSPDAAAISQQSTPKHTTPMSQKRKHGDSSVGDSETRHFAKKPRGDSKPAFKNNKRPHRPTRKLDTQSGTSNTALKNRIRDLRRLLDHADSDPKSRLPANVRIERERELEACEHELEEKLAAQKELELRRKMISKYHQVRFFGMCIFCIRCHYLAGFVSWVNPSLIDSSRPSKSNTHS